MPVDLPDHADVIIIGAGPAGLAAATELRRASVGSVLVLDRDTGAGGVPRHCGHYPFGLREFNRLHRGPDYARKLVEQARAAGADIRTSVSVVELLSGPSVSVITPNGLGTVRGGLVLLATGVRETSRAGRLIGGTKPQGVLNTGALQDLVYLREMRPFRQPVILGTELVSFSALLTCRHAGIRPVAMIESATRTTARYPAGIFPKVLRIPLWLKTDIVSIEGRDRVKSVVIQRGSDKQEIQTDGVLVTGQFRPEATLVAASHLALDLCTGGPEIDEFGRCSDASFFAAGNLLRPVETAGWSWAEGRSVAGSMVRALNDQLPAPAETRLTIADASIKYIVPQRVSDGQGAAFKHLQLRVTRPVRGQLSLMSGGQKIAERHLAALPERRILMPLPPAVGPIDVCLSENST